MKTMNSSSKEEEVKNEMLNLFHFFGDRNMSRYINELMKVVDISTQDISDYRKNKCDKSFERYFNSFENIKKEQHFGMRSSAYLYLPDNFIEKPLSCIKVEFENIYPLIISKLWIHEKIKFEYEIIGYVYSILLENKNFYKKNLSNKKGKYFYFKYALNSFYGLLYTKNQRIDDILKPKYIWNDNDYIPVLVSEFNKFFLNSMSTDLVGEIVYVDTDIIYFLKNKTDEDDINKYIKQNTFNGIKYDINNTYNIFLQKKKYLELIGNKFKFVGNNRYTDLNIYEIQKKLITKQRQDKLNIVLSE